MLARTLGDVRGHIHGLAISFLSVEAHDLDGVWLLTNDLFPRSLRLHNRLLQLDLLLEQIFDLFDVIDVVFVDEKLPIISPRPLLLTLYLLHQFALILQPPRLLGLVLPLLRVPVLLISPNIRLHLSLLLTLLDLALVLPLRDLLH